MRWWGWLLGACFCWFVLILSKWRESAGLFDAGCAGPADGGCYMLEMWWSGHLAWGRLDEVSEFGMLRLWKTHEGAEGRTFRYCRSQ